MQIILGSQSPRRHELLAAVVDPEKLLIIPPEDSTEPGFDDLHDQQLIDERLRQTVQQKTDDVRRQVQKQNIRDYCIICADTIVVAYAEDGRRMVLGKPPNRQWQSTVRHWFQTYYSGRHHEVRTCVRAETRTHHAEFIVTSTVRMIHVTDELLDWYIATEEPVGKAGGYGIQGRAAAFVNAVDGSLTNIIGLPVFEVLQTLAELAPGHAPRGSLQEGGVTTIPAQDRDC